MAELTKESLCSATGGIRPCNRCIFCRAWDEERADLGELLIIDDPVDMRGPLTPIKWRQADVDQIAEDIGKRIREELDQFPKKPYR